MFIGLGIFSCDAGQAGVFDRVFEMKVKFLVSPRRIAGKWRQQPVEAFDLAGEVPLESADEGAGGHDRVWPDKRETEIVVKARVCEIDGL